MLIPWTGGRCLVCLRTRTLSEEHLIPRALGGRLTAHFLCRDCNSALGYRIEAAVCADPTIRLSANALTNDIPALSRSILERSRYIGHTSQGRIEGHIKAGEFTVLPRKNSDGSLLQPTPRARKSIETILLRQGYDAPFREEALRKFDGALDNVRVNIAPGIEIVTGSINKLELALDGPLIDPVVPVKIAYEFLACHVGAAIYEQGPPLEEARRVLIEGGLDDRRIRIERLLAEKTEPFHGIIFEGNKPHATVLIRLIGKLAFRIHFLNLSVSGPRFVYTHRLARDHEDVRKVSDGDGQ
jgi:hypothetical protein